MTFPLCRDYVNDWILTSEEDIAKGIKFMLDTHHKVRHKRVVSDNITHPSTGFTTSQVVTHNLLWDLHVAFVAQVVEGAAGVAIGGYMANAQKFRDKTVALVACGSNIDTNTLKSLITS